MRLLIILRELEIISVIEGPPKDNMDDDEKNEWNKNNNKAMRIIVDNVKDHIVPTIANLENAYEMFTSLFGMFQINNTNRVLALKNNLS